MGVTVHPVRTRKDREQFIRLPWSIYLDDTCWIPPLLSSERRLLDQRRNPFFDHADAELFLAVEDGTPVGRIAAIYNRAHNEFHGENCGFFGFFESLNREEIVRALFGPAEDWLRAKGATFVRGPVNPSMNDTSGFVVDGFQWPPVVLMTYNPPWYPVLVERLGYAKCMDLYAYVLLHNELVKGKIDQVAAQVRERSEVTIRFARLHRFESELRLVMEIYNNAWSRNWGFIPMTDAEIQYTAADLKAILLPEFVYFAEVRGEPVGFALALPDINHVLRRCNGRLLPFGWFYFLRHNLRKIPMLRIVALGVKKEYQHMGIGTLFYQKYMEEGLKRGMKAAELSWILETNDLMNRPIRQMGGKPYKTYRLYEKKLTPA